MTHKLLCSKNAINKNKLFSATVRKNVRELQGDIWNSIASGQKLHSFGHLQCIIYEVLNVKHSVMHAVSRDFELTGYEHNHFYVVSNDAINELVMAKLADDPQLFTQQLPGAANTYLPPIKARIVDLKDDWHQGWLIAEIVSYGAWGYDSVVSDKAVRDVLKEFGASKGKQLIEQGNEVLREVDTIWDKKLHRNKFKGTMAAELIMRRRVFVMDKQ